MDFKTVLEFMDKDYIFSFHIMKIMMEHAMTEYEMKTGQSITKNKKGFNRIDTPFFHMMINKYNSYGRLDVSEYIRIQKRLKKYSKQIEKLIEDNVDIFTYISSKIKFGHMEDNERHGCSYGICDECPYQCSI